MLKKQYFIIVTSYFILDKLIATENVQDGSALAIRIRIRIVAPWIPQTLTLFTSVADPWHFGVDPDPDPRIHASD